MGGKSQQTTTSNSTTQPWQAAQPELGSILGGLSGISSNLTPTQTGAINTLESNASNGNPFTPQISNLTTDLFNGGTNRAPIVQDAYNQTLAQLTPTANGDFLDPTKNPFFADTTAGITKTVMDQLKAQWAGAGRDPSGAGGFSPATGTAIAQALAPVYGSIYSNERSNQLGAINSLSNAAGSTAGLLSGLDQTALANRQAGVGAAQSLLDAQNYGPNATLAAEAQRTGIPLSILSGIAGIATPIAGLGSQSSGTSTGTSQMSGADQFLKIMAGLSALGGGKGTGGK